MKDLLFSGAIIFTAMNFAILYRFYWAVVLLAIIVSFVGYCREGSINLFPGIGAALMCMSIFSALATILVLLCVVSLTNEDNEDEE